jgi:vacuolar protein sorting-associated protein 33A
VNGAKTLIIDQSLSNPLSLLVEIGLLKNHGVERIFWLDKTPPSVSPPSGASSSSNMTGKATLFYLLRPTMENIKLVAGHVLAHQQAQFQASASPTSAAQKSTSTVPSYAYKLLFCPHASALTNALLESSGVRGSVECLSWDMGFIPLEDDLVSLERDTAFKELWVVHLF